MNSSVSTIWVLIAGSLVFFMQAGFATIESGLTRAKNAGNIIMKNLMNFSISTTVYWLIGFGIMFAGNNLFIGGIDVLTQGTYSSILPAGVPRYAFIFFQTMFCAVVSTIISGAMAERIKFIASCIYSSVISAIVYPITAHWIWGGGWLAQAGFHDFAGAAAVNMVGGTAALVGAKMIGPRIGKFGNDGSSRAIPGHNLILTALGIFILWFCWFGFNGGAVFHWKDEAALASMGGIFFTTNLSAAVSTVTVMAITWIRYKKLDVSMTLNGSLAGLVAITAGADLVTPTGAFFIGFTAGFIVVFSIEFIDKVLKIDDPVGVIGVHGMCGAVGTLMVGLFSAAEYEYSGGTLNMPKGLFYGGGLKLFGVEFLGVISIFIWIAFIMYIIFGIIKKTVGLRVSREEEINGLDISERGWENSYGDLISNDYNSGLIGSSGAASNNKAVPIDSAVPVQFVTPDNAVASDFKFTKIDIITKQNKFEELKTALDKIGITGMTVINVLGYGAQGGRTDFYRGIKLETHLLPKIKLEIVVCKVPVRLVIETAKKVLYTGNIGDGKIFIYDVENVVKVRTGEEGYNALQDVE